MRPLPLQSVCVAVPVAALTHPTETAGGTPRSSAADATGVMLEKQGFCFSGGGGGTGTPRDSCGNHLLRTLSADLANTQFHPCCASRFPSSFCLPCLGGPKPHPSAGQGWGRGLLGKQLE